LQEFRSSGVQEFRSSGVQEFRMQVSVTETDTGLEFTTGRVEIFIEWWPTNTIHNRKAAR